MLVSFSSGKENLKHENGGDQLSSSNYNYIIMMLNMSLEG